MTEKFDIIDTASKAGKFNTFTKAVTAAGLTEVLKQPGPFTLFVPSDEAFAKIPQDKLNDLLKPENKESLKALLRYHVVPGKVMAKDLKALKTAKNDRGVELKIDSTEGVKVNGAKVFSADMEATNGVIHAIDSVLIPQAAAATPGR